MDRAVQELEAVETAIAESQQHQARELQDLQLAVMGGGCGDPILF
jgi:hypothetical protein